MYTGGIAGYNRGSITACSSAVTITGADGTVGGIAGSNIGGITACYNTGDVSGTNYAGGIAGYMSEGSAAACYNTGQVSGSVAGGIAGFFDGYTATLSQCFWKSGGAIYGEVSLGITGGGVFGEGSWPASVGAWAAPAGADGSTNQYWKSLGGWNGGAPEYPKLWWEE